MEAVNHDTPDIPIHDLVAVDRLPRRDKEAQAIRRLCDALDFHPNGTIYKPIQLVQWTLRERPEVLMGLAARHQETLQVMALATMVDEAVSSTGLSTGRLRQLWSELGDHGKAVFPTSTGAAIEALAEFPIIPNPPQPSHLARSLLIDGALVDYLIRGNDDE